MYYGISSYGEYLQQQDSVLQIGKTITDLSREMTNEYRSSTKSMIASNAMLKNEFGNAYNEMNRSIRLGFDGLKEQFSAVDYSLSEIENKLNIMHIMLDEHLINILQQMNAQQLLLKDILIELSIPEFKREQRYFIQEAYQYLGRGHIIDGHKCFLNALQTEEVFGISRVWMDMGKLTLYRHELLDVASALDYFLKAIHYSESCDQDIYVESYFHASWAKLLLDDIPGAIQCIEKIIGFCSKHGKSLNPQWIYLSCSKYYAAKYHAIAGNVNDAIRYLKEAIETDRNFCLLVSSDEDFKQCKEEVRQLLFSLWTEQRARAYEIKTQCLQQMMNYDANFTKGEKIGKSILDILSQANGLYNTETYFGFMDCISLFESVIDEVEKQKQRIRNNWSNSCKEIKESILSTCSSLPSCSRDDRIKDIRKTDQIQKQWEMTVRIQNRIDDKYRNHASSFPHLHIHNEQAKMNTDDFNDSTNASSDLCMKMGDYWRGLINELNLSYKWNDYHDYNATNELLLSLNHWAKQLLDVAKKINSFERLQEEKNEKAKRAINGAFYFVWCTLPVIITFIIVHFNPIPFYQDEDVCVKQEYFAGLLPYRAVLIILINVVWIFIATPKRIFILLGQCNSKESGHWSDISIYTKRRRRDEYFNHNMKSVKLYLVSLLVYMPGKLLVLAIIDGICPECFSEFTLSGFVRADILMISAIATILLLIRANKA